MLASKGVDLTQLSQRLDTLSTRKTFEPLEPVPEADISSYLKNEVENVLLSLVEGTHRRVRKSHCTSIHSQIGIFHAMTYLISAK